LEKGLCNTRRPPASRALRVCARRDKHDRQLRAIGLRAHLHLDPGQPWQVHIDKPNSVRTINSGCFPGVGAANLGYGTARLKATGPLR